MATNTTQGRQNNDDNKEQDASGSSNRGFAGMDPQRQREIAAEGGRASHASGNAHEFDSEEAREAGSRSHGGLGGSGSSGSSGGSQGGREQGGREPEGREQGSGSGSGGSGSSGSSGSTRGGTSEQHAEAGRQSHKNDR